MKSQTLRCVYSDTKNSRFSVVASDEKRLYFVHWLTLKKAGISGLEPDQALTAHYSLEKQSSLERKLKLSSASLLDYSPKIEGIEVLTDTSFNQRQLEEKLKNAEGITVFLRCNITQVNAHGLCVNGEIAFLDCVFEQDFRLISCQFAKNLWFSSSRFCRHFSLKQSSVALGVHMESCDFRGPGGASFRGLSTNALYVDYGVKGCEDLFWFNEITVHDVLSLGGDFRNDLEFLGNQDDQTTTARSHIKHLLIGHEVYGSETANATYLQGKLRVNETSFSRLSIANADIKEVEINHCSIEQFSLCESTIIRDLIISKCEFPPLRDTKEPNSILVQKASIERHLRLANNNFSHNVSIGNSTVQGNTYFEDNQVQQSLFDFHRLSASRMIFLPIEDFYHQAAHRPVSFQPARLRVEYSKDKNKMAEVFCTLKTWFSDAGQLKAEDDAYFFLRNVQTDNPFHRFMLGSVFGWGVRLRNIAFSTLVILFSFFSLFLLMDDKLSASTALALSMQSFFGSFFGKWPDYDPSSAMAIAAVFESIIGVVFITVFIGAYIRKLLR